jgi:uncharacterized protein (DUF1330 family)
MEGGIHVKSLRYCHLSSPDPQRLADYSKLAVPAIEPFGARLLARGDAVVALEHSLKERTVVVEYPSLEQAVAAYSSVGHAEAVKALGDGSGLPLCYPQRSSRVAETTPRSTAATEVQKDPTEGLN